MQLLNWLPCFLLAVVLPVLASQPPEDLVIDTVFKPESCPNQAKTGDSIQVHYVRILASLQNALGLTELVSLADRDFVLQWQKIRFQVSFRLPFGIEMKGANYATFPNSHDRNSPLPLTRRFSLTL